MNVEVAFSEQALSYRDNHHRLTVTASPNSPDDKLPVRHSCLHKHTDINKGYMLMTLLVTVSIVYGENNNAHI